jgi:tryptophanyl-tRNA synthetase
MRILTGITPSGTLHIGNYFGAMRPAIELQAGGDAFYFIADYHSMTRSRMRASAGPTRRASRSTGSPAGSTPSQGCFLAPERRARGL